MATFLGFGNGQNGQTTLSGTDSVIDSSCSGTAGSTSLSATNTSFEAGQQILCHQTRGTNVGIWEINYIVSYSTGIITTLFPLANTYTDSGADQAQVLVLKQYSGVIISSAFTAKAWDGNVGGILAFICSGTTNITGTVTASGKGFRGVEGGSSQGLTGRQGEGSIGTSGSRSTSANGSGGGGGAGGEGDCAVNAGAGGGGGHANNGDTGGASHSGPGGTGGSTTGSADLITMTFGGAGGEGGTRNNTDTNNAVEGNGGGIILIFSKIFINSGSIVCNGNNAVNGGSPYGEGGGAGGSIFIKGQNLTLGNNLITATGGLGTTGESNCDSGSYGGNGSVGRIRVESCTINGLSNPIASEVQGGFNFCGGVASII